MTEEPRPIRTPRSEQVSGSGRSPDYADLRQRQPSRHGVAPVASRAGHPLTVAGAVPDLADLVTRLAPHRIPYSPQFPAAPEQPRRCCLGQGLSRRIRMQFSHTGYEISREFEGLTQGAGRRGCDLARRSAAGRGSGCRRTTARPSNAPRTWSVFQPTLTSSRPAPACMPLAFGKAGRIASCSARPARLCN